MESDQGGCFGDAAAAAARFGRLSFGAAILAGMGTGAFTDVRKSLTEMVHLDRRFEPNQANHKGTRSITCFLDIYQHLKSDFDQTAAIAP